MKSPFWLKTFSWRDLAVLYGAALLLCATGSYLSYNGPLTSAAWHDWVASICETALGRGDGFERGPIIDILRAVLAGALAFFGFYRLEIIPRANPDDDPRPLNWLPVLKASTAKRLSEAPELSFQARFGYERWLLAAFLVLAVFVIGFDRPLDFLVDAAKKVPKDVRLPSDYASGNVFAHIGLVYSVDFASVTRPYLFPYSLYIMGLWYLMALPALLALLRSVRFDTLEYGRLRAALEMGGAVAQALPRNIVAIYERKCLKCFDAINRIGRRYALFLIGVFALSYLQLKWLSCSVLRNAVNTGKEMLLLLSVSSLGVMLFVYLRLHYDAGRAAKIGVEQISDALERDQTRDLDLRQATALSETVRKRDGLAELYGVFRGAGIFGIIAGLFWKFVLQRNMCQLAQATLPDQVIDLAAKLFTLHCSSAT